MCTLNRFLSKSLPVFFSILGCFIFSSSFSQSFAGYPVSSTSDARNWKTWVINDNTRINIPASLSAEQMRKELSEVKAMMGKRNETILRQIKYWDAGSPAYRWNEMGYKLVGPEFSKKGGGVFWRAPMAWMNIAIYDATIAAGKLKYNYQTKRPFEMDPSVKPLVVSPAGSSYPCEYAVTAGAAATVLAYFFPDKADSIIKLGKQAADSRVYAGVQFPGDIAQGWKLGEQVALLVIEKSKTHAAGNGWQGTISNDAGKWRGEFPFGAIASTYKPVVLRSGDQFRPPAPPDFANEMKQIKNFKQDFYTASQAYRWASLSGLDIWTDLAGQKMFELHMDKNVPACARIYTILHVALHDCAIAIMDAKYAYFGIRPDQLEPGFKPLVGFTPPFPGYPSGHATASSTAATILSYFFPADAAFFKQNAKECADSRFFAGIHFPTDNQTGLELGEKLANYIINEWAKKDGAGK
jgi:hypothetical protein